MAACRRVGEDLTAWIDAELPRRRAARLQRHLTTCTSCAAEAQRLRAVIEGQQRTLAAAVMTPVVDEHAMWRRLRRALAEGVADSTLVSTARPWRGQARETRAWRSRWALRPVAVGGAAVVVAVAVILFVWAQDPGTVLAPLGVLSPPAAVTREPEFFKDYPLIEHLDALEHFDTVQSVPLEDEQAAHRG